MKLIFTISLIFFASLSFGQTIKHDTLEVLRPDLIKVIKIGDNYYRIKIELELNQNNGIQFYRQGPYPFGAVPAVYNSIAPYTLLKQN